MRLIELIYYHKKIKKNKIILTLIYLNHIIIVKIIINIISFIYNIRKFKLFFII
jgi:hypothetical protein